MGKNKPHATKNNPATRRVYGFDLKSSAGEGFFIGPVRRLAGTNRGWTKAQARINTPSNKYPLYWTAFGNPCDAMRLLSMIGKQIPEISTIL